MFRIGQSVICTDAAGLVATNGEKFPVKGRVYTVRSVIIDPSSRAQKCIRLKEIVNPRARYKIGLKTGLTECSFRASRFTAKGRRR